MVLSGAVKVQKIGNVREKQLEAGWKAKYVSGSVFQLCMHEKAQSLVTVLELW